MFTNKLEHQFPYFPLSTFVEQRKGRCRGSFPSACKEPINKTGHLYEWLHVGDITHYLVDNMNGFCNNTALRLLVPLHHFKKP